MNTFTTVVSLIGAISAGTLAFLDLGRFPLRTRLFIVGSAALIVILAVSVKLAQLARPKSKILKTRLVLGLIAVAGVVAVAIAVLNVAVSYHAVLYGVSTRGDATELVARAPAAGAATVHVQYPEGKKCLPFDPGADSQASYYQGDPDGPLPYVGIQSFVADQVVGVRCRPAVDARALNVVVMEEHIDAMETGRRDALSRWFLIAGVIVWLAIASVWLAWFFVSS